MDHESDNFTAEMLLKQLGAGLALQGTTAAGARSSTQLLTEQEIPTAGVRIVDGSGLSSLDRLTTKAVVAMLRSSWLDEDLREILSRLAPGGRPQRDARQPHARDRRSGPRAREDGHAERGLRALGLRQAPLRVLGDPERARRSRSTGRAARRTASRRF